MKALLTGLIILCIANVLALAAFAAYLVSSDRMDFDRVRKIRALVSVPIAQEKAEEEKKAAELLAAQEAEKVAKEASKPPLTAAEQLAARVEATELDRERAARLRQEVETLQRQLAAQSQKLAMDQAQLLKDRQDFEQSTANATLASRSDQFQKALNVLAGLKPAAAKTLLKQLIDNAPNDLALTNPSTPAPRPTRPMLPSEAATPIVASSKVYQNIDEAIAYLDALEERVRGKIMTEFVKEDPVLASKLLEGLKNKGQSLSAPTQVLPPANSGS